MFAAHRTERIALYYFLGQIEDLESLKVHRQRPLPGTGSDASGNTEVVSDLQFSDGAAKVSRGFIGGAANILSFCIQLEEDMSSVDVVRLVCDSSTECRWPSGAKGGDSLVWRYMHVGSLVCPEDHPALNLLLDCDLSEGSFHVFRCLASDAQKNGVWASWGYQNASAFPVNVTEGSSSGLLIHPED